MMSQNSLLLSLILFSSCTLSQYLSCPLLGPDYPVPTNFLTDAQIQSAGQNLTQQLDALTEANSTAFDGITSFSVQWFSAEDNEALFQYHYTGSSVMSSANGTQLITKDSIYRVGSVSKLYTMYLWMAEAGDAFFIRPITDFVPELAQAAAVRDEGGVQWEDITIGALASHMGGIPRDDSQSDLIGLSVPWTELGFPELTATDLPSCGYNSPVPVCNRAVFAPFTSPIYSNTAFALLSFALEAITNKSFIDMMGNMFTQLNLTQTTYGVPNLTTNGVIPSSISYSGWSYDEASVDPAGSVFASINDLSAFGRSILNNALITPVKTRSWMKPLTFTSSMSLAVGAPWEIYRVQKNNRITDYYTKGGDIGVYSSLLALLPNYNAGFSINTADGSAADVAATLSNMVANTFGAALEIAAKAQAVGRYAGRYTASNGTNSSVVITTSDAFGLEVQSWTSEGADMFANIALTQGITSTTLQVVVRLVPTNTQPHNSTNPEFRAVFGFAGPPPTNVFNLNCATWTTVDALNYGGVPIDQFIFKLNEDGSVVGLSLPALRATMDKSA